MISIRNFMRIIRGFSLKFFEKIKKKNKKLKINLLKQNLQNCYFLENYSQIVLGSVANFRSYIYQVSNV